MHIRDCGGECDFGFESQRRWDHKEMCAQDQKSDGKDGEQKAGQFHRERLPVKPAIDPIQKAPDREAKHPLCRWALLPQREVRLLLRKENGKQDLNPGSRYDLR
jgi:hypothetical protein